MSNYRCACIRLLGGPLGMIGMPIWCHLDGRPCLDNGICERAACLRDGIWGLRDLRSESRFRAADEEAAAKAGPV